MIRGPHIRKRIDKSLVRLPESTRRALKEACERIGQQRLARKIGLGNDTIQHARNGFALKQGTADRIVAGLANLESSS